VRGQHCGGKDVHGKRDVRADGSGGGVGNDYGQRHVERCAGVDQGDGDGSGADDADAGNDDVCEPGGGDDERGKDGDAEKQSERDAEYFEHCGERGNGAGGLCAGGNVRERSDDSGGGDELHDHRCI